MNKFIFYNISLLFFISAITSTTNTSFLQQAEQHKQQQEYFQAIDCYQHAFSLESCSLQEYFNCAYCHTMLGQYTQANILYKKILEIAPNCVSVIYNMAYNFKMAGLIDEAIPLYQQAISLEPDKEETYFGLGIAYLTKGDFDNGWTLHERYLKRTERNAEHLRTYLTTKSLAGKTIVLRPEGGLGDSIQFLRYAKKLKELGAYVVVSIQKELYPLIKNCTYIDQLVKVGEPITVTYADNTTLMSMPAIWYSCSKEIVSDIHYIHPNPLLSEYWRIQLQQDPNFKIGICWGASIHNDTSRAPVARRSIPLSELYPLSTIKGVSLYSLQRYDGEEQLNDVPQSITIKTFGPAFDKTCGAFMDSAAIIPHLDLVICVDSATAHLAGVLGAPVFLMLPYSTDWRWIAHRTDSPWYPTMRLFKQSKPFDWETVVQDIYHEIEKQIQKECE